LAEVKSGVNPPALVLPLEPGLDLCEEIVDCDGIGAVRQTFSDEYRCLDPESL